MREKRRDYGAEKPLSQIHSVRMLLDDVACVCLHVCACIALSERDRGRETSQSRQV